MLNTVERKSDVGFAESHVLSDGMTHHYKVQGVKSPTQLEDELLTLFIWAWSLKDYLKELCKSKGISSKEIERLVDANDSLQFIADIANRAKHGDLRESRSKRFAKLVDVGLEIPQTAVRQISFGAFTVDLDVMLPDKIELKAFIELANGHERFDAFEILKSGLNVWEEKAFPHVGMRA
jgi:hypothetical protein